MSAHRDRPPFEMGQLVGGKYKLVKLLGEGGMSVVYQAVDISCDRVVALKAIRPSVARRRQYSNEQIRREAETLVKLLEKTEHVVEVLTAGITDDALRLPYYVMERLEGDPLRRYLLGVSSRGVVLTVEEAVSIAFAVAHALTFAHRIGVVHRDIKPENVFMATARGGESVVKVLDFGICALVGEGEEGAGFTGTLPYAAPEQLEGRAPTPATDVYALGLLMYELLALTLPHGREQAQRPGSLALQVMAAPIPDVIAARIDTPDRLARLIERCLVWDAKDRPSAHEVAKSLRDIQRAVLRPFDPSSVQTDVSDPPPEALRRSGDSSAQQVGATSKRIVGDEPVDVLAPTLPTDKSAGPKTDGDQVFFRASDLSDTTLPDAPPLVGATLEAPVPEPPERAVAASASKAAESAPDKVYVDIDAYRDAARLASGGAVPVPSHAAASSLAGFAARSEKLSPIQPRRNTARDAIVGTGIAAAIGVAAAIYGSFVRGAPTAGAPGSILPVQTASVTTTPASAFPVPASAQAPEANDAATAPTAMAPSVQVAAPVIPAASTPSGGSAAPVTTPARVNRHHVASNPPRSSADHAPLLSAPPGYDEFRETMENPVPSPSASKHSPTAIETSR